MKHISVLKKETIDQFEYLAEIESPIFVDGTLGLAGHSLAIAKINKKIKIIGIDKDEKALEIAKNKVKENNLYENFILIENDFNNIKEILKQCTSLSNLLGATASVHDDGQINDLKIDGALIDLGVSSIQLDDKSRGFSFSDLNAPLDMRMNLSQEFNAKEIVNHYSEQQIAKILTEYGEEPFSKKIAKNICKYRKNKHIEKVSDLLWVLEKSIPLKIQKTSKKHFATNSFRALRIEVNNELGDLSKTLKQFVGYLKPKAKLAVITFHSTEDRIVKNVFKELSASCICHQNAPICTCNHKATIKLINKKPIVPSEIEIVSNPRSRSAKLRIVEKI